VKLAQLPANDNGSRNMPCAAAAYAAALSFDFCPAPAALYLPPGLTWVSTGSATAIGRIRDYAMTILRANWEKGEEMPIRALNGMVSIAYFAKR
jgi:hypothetical protein